MLACASFKQKYSCKFVFRSFCECLQLSPAPYSHACSLQLFKAFPVPLLFLPRYSASVAAQTTSGIRSVEFQTLSGGPWGLMNISPDILGTASLEGWGSLLWNVSRTQMSWILYSSHEFFSAASVGLSGVILAGICCRHSHRMRW